MARAASTGAAGTMSSAAAPARLRGGSALASWARVATGVRLAFDWVRTGEKREATGEVAALEAGCAHGDRMALCEARVNGQLNGCSDYERWFRLNEDFSEKFKSLRLKRRA